MSLQHRIRRARALELVEYRIDRAELQLEQWTKAMQIASHAFERFYRAARELDRAREELSAEEDD